MKELLASKVAELDAANILLLHAPNNVRESQPNAVVALAVFVPPALERGETVAVTQAKVTTVANSDEQRLLREELVAGKAKVKVCSTLGRSNPVASGPMASKKCLACQPKRGGRPPPAPPPPTAAAQTARAGLGLAGGVKKPTRR